MAKDRNFTGGENLQVGEGGRGCLSDLLVSC